MPDDLKKLYTQAILHWHTIVCTIKYDPGILEFKINRIFSNENPVQGFLSDECSYCREFLLYEDCSACPLAVEHPRCKTGPWIDFVQSIPCLPLDDNRVIFHTLALRMRDYIIAHPPEGVETFNINFLPNQY